VVERGLGAGNSFTEKMAWAFSGRTRVLIFAQQGIASNGPEMYPTPPVTKPSQVLLAGGEP
jgi:hypothetical protein